MENVTKRQKERSSAKRERRNVMNERGSCNNLGLEVHIEKMK